MRGRAILPAALLALVPHIAVAAPGDDPRIVTIDYSQGGLFHLATSPQTQQTVLFAPGERIQSVIVSDPGAYQISVSGSGDSLSLKPNGMSALAVVSVRTDRRSYELELVPDTSAAGVPGVVRFSYGTRAAAAPPPQLPPAEQVEGWAWKLSGNKALRPLSLRDDGTRMFIEWHRDQAMPAVFAVGPSGQEQMVDGYVRGGVFTIDRLHSELVFRIDRADAKARRVKQKERHGRD